MSQYDPDLPPSRPVVEPVYTETVIVRPESGANLGWWIAGLLAAGVLLAVIFILSTRGGDDADVRLAEAQAAQARADADRALIEGQAASVQAGAAQGVAMARADAARAEADANRAEAEARAAQARAEAAAATPRAPAVVTTTSPQP